MTSTHWTVAAAVSSCDSGFISVDFGFFSLLQMLELLSSKRTADTFGEVTLGSQPNEGSFLKLGSPTKGTTAPGTACELKFSTFGLRMVH